MNQLHQSPHQWDVEQSRWTLQLLRQHCKFLQTKSGQPLSESGVWRRLRKWHISFRRTRDHITSPDVFYRAKVLWLNYLKAVARRGEMVLLYGDEHTFYRQPLAAQVWHQAGGAGRTQPRCVRHTASNTKRRTIAALDAGTGQIHWHGCSQSRVKELCLFLKKLRAAYGKQKVVLVWDNWPVHYHHKVLECAYAQKIELMWLPTYAPWLNPIEKLWKWLKNDVLTAHRHSDNWIQLRHKVESFLLRFEAPSNDLLRYCGLLTD